MCISGIWYYKLQMYFLFLFYKQRVYKMGTIVAMWKLIDFIYYIDLNLATTMQLDLQIFL